MKQEYKNFLLKLAREAIKAKQENKEISLKCPADAFYSQKLGAFVTLHKNGQLRGCIGYIEAIKPIYDTIIEMAQAAAFHDPRFPKLTKAELPEINIEISILTPLQRVKDITEIEIGKHGLLIKRGFNSGLLLPQVATEWNWDLKTFLQQTCHKAGLHGECWQQPETNIYKFSAEVFSENRKKS